MLSVGDHVYYKAGGFPVEVLQIEIVQPGQKHGAEAESVPSLENIVVSLSNDHWANGDQIDLVDGYCQGCGDPVERGCSGYCIGCEGILNDLWDDKQHS